MKTIYVTVFKKHLRVTKESFEILVLKFENSLEYTKMSGHGGSPAKCPRLHVSAFLWFAGNKATLRTTSLLFDTSVSTMFNIIRRVLNFLLSIGSEIIKFPSSQEEIDSISTAYENFILIVCSPSQICSIKNKKKTLKTTTESPESTTAQPAIIAIEIVDPNENSTTSKNKKRTIDSTLGYGYNSYDTSKPRYEVYKYSQHDIPPFKGNPHQAFKGSPNTPVNVQKSVQYSLPSITQHVRSTNAVLRPGTTLYSSLSAKGQIGGLTSSLSQISGLEHNQAPVPVVVLRIYPDQLKDSTIQANLPDHHPFAKSINSINIQSLLEHYIKALHNPSAINQYSGIQGGQSQNTYSSSQVYSAPTQAAVQQTYHGYHAPNYYTQNNYQQPTDYQTNVEPQTYQYYQQSFPQQNQYQQQQHANGVQVQEAPAKYEFSYESSTTQKQPLKKPEPVQQQYYYVQPTVQSAYATEPSQYYQPTQQLEYSKGQEQPNEPQVPQYYTQQYQDYYQEADEDHYDSKSQKLLTAENYPTNKHTRVVFRTKTGDVRTPEQEEAPAKEIKTIKIHVPDNIAKVEVQETEKPFYGFQPTYAESQQDVGQSADQYDQDPSYTKVKAPEKYYSSQDAVQQNYYSVGDTPANGNYNYQNIDYDQMVKYFSRRGAMPSYFFQSSDDGENIDQRTLSSEDMAAAYEQVAFASTTKSPEKKKAKNKKRT